MIKIFECGFRCNISMYKKKSINEKIQINFTNDSNFKK
jgi:hypothetical protein